jgi:hypothetical protein
MIDDIFGVLIDPYWRRVAHLEELIEVKYLNHSPWIPNQASLST